MRPLGSANAAFWEVENTTLLELFERTVAQGDGFLDVGANVGLFAIPVAERVGPSGKVYAFEPAPDMAQALLEAARARGVADRIELRQLALGAERATLELRVDPEDPSDVTKRSLFVGGDVVAEVSVRPLDELVRSGELVLDHPLRAVKIDVEGAELLCLRGMRSTLSDHNPSLVVVETIESHLRRTGFELADVHVELGSLGYRSDASVDLRFNTAFVPG